MSRKIKHFKVNAGHVGSTTKRGVYGIKLRSKLRTRRNVQEILLAVIGITNSPQSMSIIYALKTNELLTYNSFIKYMSDVYKKLST